MGGVNDCAVFLDPPYAETEGTGFRKDLLSEF